MALDRGCFNPLGCPVKGVIFDYGGVLAEEGYVNTISALATSLGKDPERTLRAAEEAVFASGYMVGKGTEGEFWGRFRELTGITLDDGTLREMVLKGFVLRPHMVEVVNKVRTRGIKTFILSDQTDWLEELDRRDRFFQLFDGVYNSYRTGYTKRQREAFENLLSKEGLEPREALFVDDREENVKLASSLGIHSIRYVTKDQFLGDFLEFWM
ncbi:HAD family hydrolase [Thermanaerovibrio velox]|uniref:HAD family hydrolase n=1 Tax=Thermanaerovibrio velox TaxID=108007 RepID=UPI001FDF2247|nr:HAD family phosphatase [Thermanaerovibrio velox]